MGHVCIRGNEHETLTWNVERLWELARDLPVEMVPVLLTLSFCAGRQDLALPLASFWLRLRRAVKDLLAILEGIDCVLPDERSCMHMARHAKRVLEADLSHPILLSAEGDLFDGSHRIAKAWVLGMEEMQAVRFPVTPEPDERVPKVVV